MDKDRYFALDDIRLNDENDISPFSLTGMDGRHGRHGNVLMTNGQFDLLTDTIRPGAVERWRVVNTANARTMWFSVDGASMRVVGTDGGLLPEPYTTRRVQIPVGQRYDIEVVVDDDAEAVSLQLKLPNADGGFDAFPLFEATVEGEPSTTPTPDWAGAPLPEVEDFQQELEMVFDLGTGGRRDRWTINGLKFTEDREHIQAEGKTPTKLVLKNDSFFEHPFHLHGQFFEILTVNGAEADEPGLKDTVLLAPESEVVVYTSFDNPGLWMVHCHILEHAELGMMVVMDVSDGEEAVGAN